MNMSPLSIDNMLAIQHALQVKSFGNDPKALTEEERAEWIRWNMLALEDELHEALAETGWKPWATSKHVNREAFISELVDAWHFFMNLLLVVDCSAAEFTQAYAKKRKLNAERQAAGYDGVTGKCGNCMRALDDEAVACTESRCALDRN